jgi:glycosyltransferase involved in cell wall biosynthesis
VPTYASPPRSRRVLMVISVLARGGCERLLLATARGLLQRGYTLEIFTLAPVPSHDPSMEAEFAALGIGSSCAADFGETPCEREDGQGRHGLERFRPLLRHLDVVQLGEALERVIRRFDPGVVHCWSEPSSVIGGLVAAALGVPRIIIRLVNVPPFRLNLPGADLYRDAYRLLLGNKTVQFLNGSVANARDLEEWLGVPSGSVKALYNGFRPDSVGIRNGDEAELCRRNLGIPPDAPVVGAIMRFAPEKDPGLWIETAARVAAVRPDVRFLLGGYGALAETIAHRIEELELSPRFILPGTVTDLGAVYACMDVFLMTSLYDGTPSTLVEAQAVGVPVVAPQVGGIGETMLHERTGLLTATRDAQALADAVLRILNDRGLRRSAAKYGPRFVAKRFNWPRNIDTTIAFYRGDSLRLGRAIDWMIRRLPVLGTGKSTQAPPIQ